MNKKASFDLTECGERDKSGFIKIKQVFGSREIIL